MIYLNNMDLFSDLKKQERQDKEEERKLMYPMHQDIHYKINFKVHGINGLQYYKYMKSRFHNYMLHENSIREIYTFLKHNPVRITNDLLISTKTIKDHHPFTFIQLVNKYELIAVYQRLGWNNNIYKSDNLF